MSLEEGQTGIRVGYGREEERREKTSRSAGVFSRNLWWRKNELLFIYEYYFVFFLHTYFQVPPNGLHSPSIGLVPFKTVLFVFFLKKILTWIFYD